MWHIEKIIKDTLLELNLKINVESSDKLKVPISYRRAI